MVPGTRETIGGVPVDQLVALADGTRPDPAVAERVAASGEATDALDAQRRALVALRAFDPPPLTVHEAPARASRPAKARRLRPLLVGAGALAAVTLAIVVAPGSSSPTVAAVATLAALPAVEQPPHVVPGSPELGRSFSGVAFPEWNTAHGWLAIGARRDTVDGRATDTVFYRHTHHRIGYTVIDGPPLPLSLRGRRINRNGVSVQLYNDGPRTVAVFERGGHTCVLAGIVHFEDTLVKLAAWRGDDDSLPF